MARPASPEFAAKLATGASVEEHEALKAIARAKRVKVAAVLRWAIEEYLERNRPAPSNGAEHTP